jgi:SprT protein
MKKPFKYLVEAVNKKEKELKNIIETHYGHNTAPNIDITFDLDRKRVLGMHVYYPKTAKHQIKINAALLNELKYDYINEIFTHEYAHAMVRHYIGFFNNGKKVTAHGKEFKSFCRVFGIEGKATSDIARNSKALENSGRKTQKFIYKCDCNTFEFSIIRHNRSKRGRKYYCRKCGQHLTPAK